MPHQVVAPLPEVVKPSPMAQPRALPTPEPEARPKAPSLDIDKDKRQNSKLDSINALIQEGAWDAANAVAEGVLDGEPSPKVKARAQNMKQEIKDEKKKAIELAGSGIM